jgi:YHS domain-containing protein
LQIVMSIVSVLGLGFGTAVAGPEHDHSSTKADFASVMPKCPVMDEPINFFVKAETEDGPVYFCCDGCVDKYKANPGKYVAKVAAQRAALAELPKVQVSCPVTGKPVDGKTSIEHNGEKVNFCCPKCVDKFQKDPSKYKTALANSYTYQAKCPVMGGDIDPQSFTTLAGGQKIYFCCPGCEGPLFKESGKYASKLEAQGFKIKPEQIKRAKEDKDGGHDHSGHDHGDH